MFHLTVRVAWHDSRWNGPVCQKPSENCSCAAVDRVRDERDEEAEDALAGLLWNRVQPGQLPIGSKEGVDLAAAPHVRPACHVACVKDRASPSHTTTAVCRFTRAAV